VFVNAYCHCSEREADGLVRLAGFFSTGNVALICDERDTLDALGRGRVDRNARAP
jgi:hypothetical protein